jgi:hypothetical protein
MFFIRQNATHKVVIGPVVAVANGYVPVTTLALNTADEAEAILHDNGTVVDISAYTFAAIATADGYYHLTLQSGISGSVGHMTVVVNDDSLCLPVKADFTVIEEAVYDSLYAASAPGYVTNQPVDVNTIKTQTVTCAAGVTVLASVGTAATSTAQTGDAFARLGAPAGASVSADVAAVKVDTAAILADTGTDGVVVAAASKTGYTLTATTGLGNQTADITGSLSGSVGSVTGAVGSVTGAVGSVTGLTASDVAAIKAKTDSLVFTVANQVDSNVQYVNDVAIQGNGQSGTEWGPV